MKIAHLSDIHFGRIAHPHILDALLRDVEQAGVDLVAVSGDLTQRALPRQFEEAVAYLNKFKMPRIVVPGNHDVYPWWNPYSRLRKPVARYKQFFGDDLFPSFETENFALFGINSAHGLTIKGGKITPVILRAIKDYFENLPHHVFKVLMLHHHLIPVDALQPHDISVFGPNTFQVAVDLGIDLILCGHVHLSHVETLATEKEKKPVIASAGTATSDRGRRSNRNRNLYNLIEVLPEQFTIRERAYQPEDQCFVTERESTFDRRKWL